MALEKTLRAIGIHRLSNRSRPAILDMSL